MASFSDWKSIVEECGFSCVEQTDGVIIKDNNTENEAIMTYSDGDVAVFFKCMKRTIKFSDLVRFKRSLPRFLNLNHVCGSK